MSNDHRDPVYRASRAEHYRDQAISSLKAHGKAKTEMEKTEHEAALAHAADRASVHARFVIKHAPGSDMADMATLNEKIAKIAYDSVKSKTKD